MKNKTIGSSDWEETPPNFVALTPLDGRNYHKVQALSNYFSEFALNRTRLLVEIRYLIFLAQNRIAPPLSRPQKTALEKLLTGFDLRTMREIREFEKQTNHDTKAVEYFLKAKLKAMRLPSHVEFVHWALTSEDVNNLSYSLLLKNYTQTLAIPMIKKVLNRLKRLISRSNIPIIGRTHGQPANVTTLAKELAVFYSRLVDELNLMSGMQLQGKLNGAVGSFADQAFSYPEKDWLTIEEDFVQSLGLEPALATTQILPYDSLIRLFDAYGRLQQIALDLTQNLWLYLSFDFLYTRIRNTAEVGSSVMPQKVNPIYLEGAEGGFELSNALLAMYKTKLSHSRLQHDLSDSTVRRSFGIAFAYSYLSWQSVVEALERLEPNRPAIGSDREKHWEVLTGAVQTYLRSRGYDRPYEVIARHVKGKTFTHDEFINLIDTLAVKSADKRALKQLSFEKLAQPCRSIVKRVLKKKIA